MNLKNYYRILGVSYDASYENIINAYRREYDAIKYDLESVSELIEAYSVLADPEKRKLYDVEFINEIGKDAFILGMQTSAYDNISLDNYYSSLIKSNEKQSLVEEENNKLSENQSEGEEDNKLNEKSIEELKQRLRWLNLRLEDEFIYAVHYQNGMESNDDSEIEKLQEEILEIKKELNLREQEETKKQEEIKKEAEEVKKQEEIKKEEAKKQEEIKKEEAKKQEEIKEEETKKQEEIKKEEAAKNQDESGIGYIPVEKYKYVVNRYINEPEKEETPKTSSSEFVGLKRGLIIGGSIATGVLVLGTIPGVLIGGTVGVAVGDFYKKNAGKIKLEKVQKEVKVDEFKTSESKLFEAQAKDLDDKIYDLLSRPNKNYELAIAKLQYKNKIELLEKRMELQRASISKNGVTMLDRIKLKSLERQHKKSGKRLELFDEYIGDYEKNSRLSKLNEEIKDYNLQNQELENSNDEEKKNNIRIKLLKKLSKRDDKANKMVLKRDGITRRQTILLNYNIAKSKISQLVDKLKQYSAEIKENQVVEEETTSFTK